MQSVKLKRDREPSHSSARRTKTAVPCAFKVAEPPYIYESFAPCIHALLFSFTSATIGYHDGNLETWTHRVYGIDSSTEACGPEAQLRQLYFLSQIKNEGIHKSPLHRARSSLLTTHQCLPERRVWPEKCRRCVSKDLECSAPQRKNVALSAPDAASTGSFSLLQFNGVVEATHHDIESSEAVHDA
jgi:hypothetical protein